MNTQPQTQTPPKQVRANQLDENGPFIHIRGNVLFPTLTRRIQGKELERNNKRITRNGGYAKNSPYITATLADPEILPVSGDPGNLTINEFYVFERFYNAKNPQEGESGKRYTQDSVVGEKGSLPPLFKRVSDTPNRDGGYEYEQITDYDGEFAPNTPVRLVLRVYSVPGQANRGVSIHSVYAETTQPEFTTGREAMGYTDRKKLAERGIIIVGETVRLDDAEAPQDDETDNQPQPNTDADGLPTAMTASAPQAQPQQQFFQPQQQAPATPQVQQSQPQAPQAPQVPSQPESRSESHTQPEQAPKDVEPVQEPKSNPGFYNPNTASVGINLPTGDE